MTTTPKPAHQRSYETLKKWLHTWKRFRVVMLVFGVVLIGLSIHRFFWVQGQISIENELLADPQQYRLLISRAVWLATWEVLSLLEGLAGAATIALTLALWRGRPIDALLVYLYERVNEGESSESSP